MICYNPIPLFEASLFLANQAAGVSWNSFLERTFGKGENCLHSQALSSYSKILTELEQRLRASITVQRSRSSMPLCTTRAMTSGIHPPGMFAPYCYPAWQKHT